MVKIFLTMLTSLSVISNSQEYWTPATSFVDDQGITYRVEDGEAYVYSAKNTPEYINIPDSITYYDSNLIVREANVTKIGKAAFDGNKNPLSISGMNNIESIEAQAFKGVKLKKINIDKGIEIPNLISIGDEAFYNVNDIIRINAPKLESIGIKTFYSNDSLKYINSDDRAVIDFNISDYSFLDSISLENVEYTFSTLPKGSFKNTKSLDTFTAENLRRVNQEAFENSGIKSLKSNLVYVEDEAFKNSSLKTIGDEENVVNLSNVIILNSEILNGVNTDKVILDYIMNFSKNSLIGLNAKDITLLNYSNSFNASNLDKKTNIISNEAAFKALNYKTTEYEGIKIDYNYSNYFDVYFTDLGGENKMLVFPKSRYNVDFENTVVKNAKLVKKENYFILDDINGDVSINFSVKRENPITILEVENKLIVDPVTKFQYEKFYNEELGLYEFGLKDASSLKGNLALNSYVEVDGVVYNLSKIFKDSLINNKNIAFASGPSINNIEEGTFKNFTNLKNVNFPSLTSVEKEVFYNTGLIGFNSSEYLDLSKIKYIDESSFYGIRSESVLLSNDVEIGENAFSGSVNLKNINTNGAKISKVFESSFHSSSKFDRFLYINNQNDLETYDLLDGELDDKLFGLLIKSKYGAIHFDENELGTYKILTERYSPLGFYLEIIPKNGYTFDKNSVKINNSTRIVKNVDGNVFLIYGLPIDMNLDVDFVLATN